MSKKTINIKFPLELSDKNYFFTLTDNTNDAIISNLNFFITVKEGERLYNSRMGFGIEKYLFEPLDQTTIRNLKEELTGKIKDFFPQIKINKLTTEIDNNSYIISLNVEGQVNGTNFESQINF